MRAATYSALVLLLLLAQAECASSQVWLQTTWTGATGQQNWSDTTRFLESFRMSGTLTPGDLKLQTPNDSAWTLTGTLASASAALCLAEDPSGNMYCGTGSNGDVFKTTDNGASWTNTANMTRALTVQSLICDSGGLLWAGTGDSGYVFTSTDGGVSWNRTSAFAGPGYAVVSSLLDAGGSVYAGTYDRGDVFRTTDGGVNWLTTSDITGATDVNAMLFIADTIWIGTFPNGDVFTTTDQGTNWLATGELISAVGVYSLLAASDSNVYAGTGDNASVFRTTDRGAAWSTTGSLSNSTMARDLLELDRVLYAATTNIVSGHIFKSTNYGANWIEILSAGTLFEVNDLHYSSRGFIFAAAATSSGGKVYRAGYYPSGYLVSSVYSAPGGYGTLNWSLTPNGMTSTVRVRTDVNPDMSSAVTWPSCPAVSNGQDISAISSVSDTEEYVQYRIEFSSSDNSRSPVLHWISLQYGTNLQRDAGIVDILSPDIVVTPGTPLAPSANVANFGERAESIWVFCEIDSIGLALPGPIPIYRDSVSLMGIAPSETSLAQFASWTPGPSGSAYSVLVSLEFPDDTVSSNDSLEKETVSFTPYYDMQSVFSPAPVIDGTVSPGEWDSATAYEVSDIYGVDGQQNLPASCNARFLHDDNFLYLLVRAYGDTLLQAGDNASIFVDDNNNQVWEAGDAEGEYYLTRGVLDTIWFNAHPSLTAYPVPGALIAMADSQGIVIEAAIPFGTDGPSVDAGPGETLGIFIDYMDQAPPDFMGWWPQTVLDSLKADPALFGKLALAPGTGVGLGLPDRRPVESSVVSTLPDPFRDQTRITYVIGPGSCRVNLSIYDASGRLVQRLLNGTYPPGMNSIIWDGRSDSGARVRSGVYILRLDAGGRISTRKLTRLD